MSKICPITLAEIEYQRTLKCGHTFENSAIGRWLHDNPSCPVCRSPAYYLTEDEMHGIIRCLRHIVGTLREDVSDMEQTIEQLEERIRDLENRVQELERK